MNLVDSRQCWLQRQNDALGFLPRYENGFLCASIILNLISPLQSNNYQYNSPIPIPYSEPCTSVYNSNSIAMSSIDIRGESPDSGIGKEFEWVIITLIHFASHS